MSGSSYRKTGCKRQFVRKQTPTDKRINDWAIDSTLEKILSNNRITSRPWLNSDRKRKMRCSCRSSDDARGSRSSNQPQIWTEKNNCLGGWVVLQSKNYVCGCRVKGNHARVRYGNSFSSQWCALPHWIQCGFRYHQHHCAVLFCDVKQGGLLRFPSQHFTMVMGYQKQAEETRKREERKKR